MPKISIIIPVYNAEQYLEECLLSISQQTFGDFEIWAINDGSTDRSLEILKKHQEKEPRLHILSQENKGVSAARNLGLENATGEYIGFVDADDFVDKKFFENLLNSAETELADLVIANKDIYNRRVYNQNTIAQYLLPTLLKEDTYNAIWDKLFIRELIVKNEIKFPLDIPIGEDVYFNILAFSKAKKIIFINENGYCYREVENSATKNLKKNDFLKTNVEIYQRDFSIILQDKIDYKQILELKQQRFIKSIIPLIYIYFKPKNGLTFLEKIIKVKKILSNPLVKEAFHNNKYDFNFTTFEKAIFEYIKSRNLFMLFILIQYSYFRNINCE